MVGTHEDLSRTHAVTGSSNRSFGFVFTAFFALIGLWPVVRGDTPRGRAIAAAAVLLMITWLAPALLALPKRLWLRFGALLHRIVSPLVLGFLFYAVVTPMGVVMRMLGKDSMRRRPAPGQDSHWIKRDPPGPPPESLVRQF